jgi:hypothetical protein
MFWTLHPNNLDESDTTMSLNTVKLFLSCNHVIVLKILKDSTHQHFAILSITNTQDGRLRKAHSLAKTEELERVESGGECYVFGSLAHEASGQLHDSW